MTIRDQLAAVDDRLRCLRAEKARATRVFDIAKASVEAVPEGMESGPQFEAAKATKEALNSVSEAIEKVTDEQTGLLRKLADQEVGQAGFAYPGISGWDEAAERLSLSRGELRADVPAQTLFRPSLRATTPTGATAPAPDSNRWLYPVFDSAPFGDSSADLVATDFTISLSETTLTGIEISTAAATEKATLSPTVGLAMPQAKTFAVVLNNVPAKVFDSFAAVRALLSNEMGRQLSEAFDVHVVTKIEAASPPSGSTGSTLIAKIRNAIADMREIGGQPRYLALTPADAASLDLSTDGEGHHIFRVDLEGSGNPIWSLRVREVPTVSDPLLVDPDLLGLSYVGGGTVLVDPFSAMTKNQVRARCEAEAVFHIRNSIQGAYAIA